MNFLSRDIISIHEFEKEEIIQILDRAMEMVPIAEGKQVSTLLQGKILATIFFEPSTRTMLSFESAMHRLGGSVIGFSDPAKTSTSKGETLTDAMKMIDAYSDLIVIRHPNEGAARLAAQASDVPVINAGDGAGQHPTQTLLDLFTIKTETGSIEGKNVVLMGDLKYGRTVHSLAFAMAKFGARMSFVAPRTLQMPQDYIRVLDEKGANYKQFTKLEEVISDADVIYVTRIQRERFPDINEYTKIAGSYQINRASLEGAKDTMIIMHPLPRVDEISIDADDTPHAKYFRQAFNGVPVRMALLAMVLGK